MKAISTGKFERVKAGLLLYVAGPLLSYATTLSWLRPNALFARGDIFPYIFLNPEMWLHRVWFAWDTKINLGGPADMPKFVPLVLFSGIFHHGLSPIGVQHLYYGLMLALQFAGMAFLTQTLFPGRTSVAIVSAAFFCFNVSMFQVLPFPMFMFFLAYTPFMIALMIKALGSANSDASLLLFIALSSLSAFLFVNPPTYALFVATLAVVSVVLAFRNGLPDRRRAVRILLGVCGVIAVNVFWLIPSYDALFGAGHQQVSAQRDDTFLTFVSRRSDMLNVYWLMPYWAWDFKIYYPFKPDYDAAMTVLCSFFAPALFFSALLSKTLRRRLVIILMASALVLMLLTTGVQPPYGVIGTYLYAHMPFYWLFREPTTKFPLILVIVMAPIVGWQCASLINTIVHRISVRGVEMRALLVAIAVLAICEPAYPMITGQLEGARDYGGVRIVSNDVHIPAYWYSLSNYLAAVDPNARVLMLPNDDFYQINYLWGLYASDVDVLAELLTNPFVIITDSSYQGYLTPSKSYSHFQDELYLKVHSDPPGSLMPYLAAQGVRFVLQRNDVNSEIPGREILNSRQALHLIRSTPELRFVRSFGALDLYEVRRRDYVPPIYTVPSTIARAENIGEERALAVTARSLSPAEFKQKSPVAVTVTIRKSERGDRLVWAESYSPSWIACRVDGRVCRSVLPHEKAYGFENAWELPAGRSYKILLRYSFQNQLYLGDIISVTALFLTVALLIRRILANRRATKTSVGVA